ncbi:MAG: hypothetical protein A2039_01240 [Candidatus Melainabacteria bacterium GWA2_34_9]|nr:MAG: hypothetical protein A2039_01240 [Candidatus Melainabacteria bacterium GWA2_34_9]
MLLHNYLDSGNYTASLVKNNLSNIPNTEIQSIKKRVDFYVNHYKISTQKTASESKVLQLDFLLNLNHILENEIQERKAA